jgi:hypothetical protein
MVRENELCTRFGINPVTFFPAMAFSLSRILRTVCYLLAIPGLFFVTMPFIDVALHRYDGPVAFFAGVFVLLLAMSFFFLSRSKAASQPGERPIIAGILWTISAIFGAAAIRLLYFGIRTYL